MKSRKIIYFILIVAIVLLGTGTYLLLKEKEPIEVTVTTANDFNSKMIREINKTEKSNYLISPYSIEIALNMLRDGANGQTKSQIDSLIGERQISDVTVKDKINVVSAAFIKNEYKNNVTKSYYQKLYNNYNADILYDEFKNPKVMNDWVNKETDGMIKEITDRLSKDFVLGIANAVAIDVEWKSPFECSGTNEEDFTKIDNNKYSVSMMHHTYNKYDKVKYFETDTEKGIVLPYKSYDENGKETSERGNNLEFIGILSNNSIKDYVSNINDKVFERIDSNLKELNDNEKIKLSLPMFKYDYRIPNFLTSLKNLGVTTVFDPNDADLNNMIKKEGENFYVSDAIHKTHIDLNEKGTKAAAVTAFIIDKNTAMPTEPSKIIEIKFNKPFAYMIRDTKTKEILFFGVVYEPLKWEGSTCK